MRCLVWGVLVFVLCVAQQGAAETEAKNEPAVKKRRSNKDWATLTDADIDKMAGKILAEDLDSDDDFYEERLAQFGKDAGKKKKDNKRKVGKAKQKGESPQIAIGPDGKPYFPNGFDLDAMKAQQHRNKPQLMFIKLKEQYQTDDKELQGALAARWKDLMASAGIDAGLYNVDKKTVLVSLQKGQFGSEVKEFALRQPETDYFEWDSKKHYPDA